MTWSSNSIVNYEFTAFTEADLLKAGDHSLSCGDKFVMPASSSVCFTVADNDRFLSGDTRHNENADDWSHQTARIMDANGDEVGNGRQIYAEQYHWVSDQHGNWYVLVEIEQEGSGEDYFAFFTGGGYTVPPAGAHLTVHGACDVRGDWLKFEDLDSGPKPEPEPATGSICGSVFCDTNHDGIDGIVTVEPGHDYVIEAEHMFEHGFTKFHGSQASGGQGVKLDCAGGDGYLKTTFNGKTGVYDVTIRVQDENDGKSVITLLVDGKLVEAVRLDRDSDGGGSDHGGFSHFVIRDVAINQHSEIKLVVDGEHGEFVRIDNLKFEGQDKVVRAPEPPKEGVTVFLLKADGTNVLDANGQPIQTVTDADGKYEFTNVPVGDYRVKFVAPDGTVFTSQNQGGDDRIDSDVNDAGVSDVFTVSKDQKTSDIDAGLKDAPTGSICGSVFCDTNHDGIDGTITVEPGHDYVIEAEHMIRSHEFITFHGSQASGGAGVKLKCAGDDGWLKTTFNGKTGVYDVTIRVQDENDGKSVITLLVDGKLVEAVRLDRDSDGGGSDHGGFSHFVIRDVAINEHSEIKLVVDSEHAEFVRIDNIQFEGQDKVVRAPEPPKEGVTVFLLNADGTNVLDANGQPIQTVTDAEGKYEFTNVPVGDYRVKFVAPDGTVFTSQNQGGDDRIDSDVNDAGVSDVFTVSKDEKTKDIDAGVKDAPLGSLSGRYFCDENDNDVDDGEPGIAGVRVLLLDADGNPTGAETTTADDGSYSFGDLTAGIYGVRFVDTVSGKTLVAPNVGADDAIDSDAIDEGNGVSVIRGIVVVAGQDTPDNDAGVEQVNEAPVAVNDEACVCDGEAVTIDVLANDSDLEDGAPTITAIDVGDGNGFVAIAEGQQVTLASGATVTLLGGKFVYDVSGVDAFDNLLVGEMGADSFIYQVTDSEGETASAQVDVTVKGDEYTLAMLDEDLGEVGHVTGQLFFSGTTVGGFIYDFEVTAIENPTSRLGEVLANLDPSRIELTFCLSINSPIDFAPLVNEFSIDVLDAASFSTALAGATPLPGAADFGFNPQNADNVAWLLNEADALLAEGFTEGNIQRAIWNLINGGPNSVLTGSQANAFFAAQPQFGMAADALVLTNRALANDGFVAGEGDIVALILDPKEGGVQPLVIGVEFDVLKELCDCDSFAWM